MFARVSRFVTTVARHGVPLGGILGRDWHPVTAVAVYWVESLLLVLAAAALCWLMQRRVRVAIDDGHAGSDPRAARALDEERRQLTTAGINPKDVLVVHLGSILIFGGFFGGLIVIMVGNGYLEEPIRWPELRQGVEAMAVIVAIAFAIDMWTFSRLTIAQVQARVDACMTRWALFWLLGFFGTLMLMFSGRPAVFFGFFAVLKTTFESWAGLARLLGWKSLRDRAAATASTPQP